MIREIQLVECPRDAMQGWKKHIPTPQKVEYLNALLKVGFHTLDFGSFVSARAIPQMADTADVVSQLNMEATKTKLLAIVANLRGAQEASSFDQISFLGYPFSISETFQQRNANSSIRESVKRVDEILDNCSKTNKELVVYISMGFGNPYGDLYNNEIVFQWVSQLAKMGVTTISLADTVGIASPETVFEVTACMVDTFPELNIGVHLHSTEKNWKEKLEAAIKAGCYRYDGALKGIGGCPMANDNLIGNMNTEWMINYFQEKNCLDHLHRPALEHCLALADKVFEE